MTALKFNVLKLKQHHHMLTIKERTQPLTEVKANNKCSYKNAEMVFFFRNTPPPPFLLHCITVTQGRVSWKKTLSDCSYNITFSFCFKCKNNNSLEGESTCSSLSALGALFQPTLSITRENFHALLLSMTPCKKTTVCNFSSLTH